MAFISIGVIFNVKLACLFMEKQNFENRLEKIRKENCITQEDLVHAVKVSRQTIGSLENGRYNPSIILAFKIARFFNLTIEEIFIYDEDENEQ